MAPAWFIPAMQEIIDNATTPVSDPDCGHRSAYKTFRDDGQLIQF